MSTDKFSPKNLRKPVEKPIFSIIRHKVDERESLVELLVEKRNNDRTWMPEAVVHRHDEGQVLAYWDKHGGRYEATGLEEYHVLRILAHHPPTSKPPSGQYKVQWVGYSSDPEDVTWEFKSKIRKIAPDAAELYEKSRVRIKNDVKAIAKAQKSKVVGKAIAKPVSKPVRKPMPSGPGRQTFLAAPKPVPAIVGNMQPRP